MLLDVIQVTALPHFTLLVEFENGERRTFHMSDYMDQQPWSRLKSGNVFQGAFVENGTVAWPGNVDIDPETLYEQSLPFSDSSLKITQAVKASGSD